MLASFDLRNLLGGYWESDVPPPGISECAARDFISLAVLNRNSSAGLKHRCIQHSWLENAFNNAQSDVEATQRLACRLFFHWNPFPIDSPFRCKAWGGVH